MRHRDAQEVAGPSIGLAALVLAFLGFSFSGVEGSQADVYDIPFSVSSRSAVFTPDYEFHNGAARVFGFPGLQSLRRGGLPGWRVQQRLEGELTLSGCETQSCLLLAFSASAFRRKGLPSQCL